ncbi:MAG: hypothetical protein IPG53_11945 [Ignavibacteriales bacterium]|nr:hypothetical protein [Ignavibacteriales bacterium]
MNHKRTAVQLSVRNCKDHEKQLYDSINFNMDFVISECILIDVGKFTEYDRKMAIDHILCR